MHCPPKLQDIWVCQTHQGCKIRIGQTRGYYECDKALKPRGFRTPSVKLTVWGESLVRRRNDWKCNVVLPESDHEFPRMVDVWREKRSASKI